MTAANVNLELDQGSDFTVQIHWLNQDSEPYLVVPPIRMELRTNDGVNQLVTQFESGTVEDDDAYDIVYSKTNGLIQLHISAERSNVIPPGTYRYDLFTHHQDPVSNAIRTHRLIEGYVQVNRKVTRNV